MKNKIIPIFILIMFVSGLSLNEIPVKETQTYLQDVEKREVIKYTTKIVKPRVARLKYSEEELILIAKLIEHEARGENMVGKIAVGNVLINRCFGDKKLLKQEAFRANAFTGFKKAYPNIKPSKESIQAAKMVLSGHKVVSRGTRYFLNRRTATNHWIERNCKLVKRIGNHSFYEKGDK